MTTPSPKSVNVSASKDAENSSSATAGAYRVIKTSGCGFNAATTDVIRARR